jgi:hypothetical protein
MRFSMRRRQESLDDMRLAPSENSEQVRTLDFIGSEQILPQRFLSYGHQVV